LTGPTAISIDTEGAKLISNGAKGFILAELDVIDMFTDAGVATRIVNKGVMYSFDDFGYAVSGGAGNETVVNKGQMYGIVDLGAGNDVFDGRGGTYGSGAGSLVVGGAGDDKLVTGDASIVLSENASEGFDRVHSTVSYTLNAEVEFLQLLGKKNIDGTGNGGSNFVYGNGGNNLLDGGAGGDVLRGFKGIDTLTGGTGTDFFVFGTGDGKDTITDFEIGGVDVINLFAWKAIKDFADVLDHATDKNGDVVITVGNDSLRIENFTAATLAEAFFSFNPL